MRTTRLTAAGVAAVLALGGTVAAASTTAEQTVTIEVASTALSISVSGNVTFSVEPGSTANGTDTSSEITFENPSSSATNAKIELGRSGGDLGGMTLTGNLFEDGDPFGQQRSWTGTNQATLVVSPVAGFAPGTQKTVGVLWDLAGTAPTSPGSIVSTFTFTISLL